MNIASFLAVMMRNSHETRLFSVFVSVNFVYFVLGKQRNIAVLTTKLSLARYFEIISRNLSGLEKLSTNRTNSHE